MLKEIAINRFLNRANGLLARRLSWQLSLGVCMLAAIFAACFALNQKVDAAGSGGQVTGIAGKCLANENGVAANGNKIQIENCVAGANQTWSWTGDKTLRVQGFCLDVQSSGMIPGTPVRLWTCNGSGAQQWRPMADGSLINVASNLCLETVGGALANGTSVHIATCSASAPAQDWNISQAVITLDPPAFAPHAPLPGGAPHTPAPAITLDYAMAPEFKTWLEAAAKPLLEAWYPVLVDYYAYPHHHSQVRTNLTIAMDPAYSGVAFVDQANGRIVISPDYMRNNLSDGGLLIHEATHILQWNPARQSSGVPGWIVEGWADHAREVVYQDRPLRQPVNDENIFSGYSPTSLMLDAAEASNGATFLKELSTRGWQGTYNNGMFAEVAGASLGGLWFATTSQSSSDPGRITHTVTGKCIDLPFFATDEGTLMQIQGCNNSQAQEWVFKAITAGAKAGVIVGYGNKCLAVTGSATANGSPVSYRSCASSANAGQKWEYVGGTLRNPNSGKCLQPIGGATSDGTKLEIQPCNGSLVQQWTLPPIYNAAPSVTANKVLYPAIFSDGQQGIGMTDASGNGYNRLLTASAGNSYDKPNLSPNGAKVAFLQTTNAQQTLTLRVANTDGTSNTQLTTNGYFVSTSAPRPLWSADNARVLVAVTPNGQTATDKQWLWLWVNADGSGQQVVSSQVIGGTPFAVFNNKIYFYKNAANALCSVDSNNGSGEVCFGQAANSKDAALSPVGDKVASLANGTVTGIQLTNVGGSITSTVSLSPLGGLSDITRVAWVPNTGKIAFYATVNGKSAWYAVDPAVPAQINKLNINAIDMSWWASAAPTLKGGAYTALSPFRVTDTRVGSGQLNAGKTLASQSTLDIQVAGLGGVPAEGASAVVLNITAASATSAGFLTVFPTGTVRSIASTVNTVPNEVANNQTTVGLSANGKVSIFNAWGSTDIVVDVVGYYSENGGTFTPTAPKRVIDTRTPVQTIPAGGTLNVQVTGVQGIPSSAVGIVADVTEVNASGNGYLTLYPAGTGFPNSSSVNYLAGKTITKEVNVKLSASGALTVASPVASTDVIIDVVGYYTADATGLSYASVNPTRVADTRTGSGQPYAGQALGQGAILQVGFGSGVLPSNAAAAVNNLTIASATAPGTFLTAFPANLSAPPSGTSVTYTHTVAFNQGTVLLSGGPAGGFKLYNLLGTTNVVVDSLGYYY
ncbi:MAG TPA: ricin-type beta-trefoil lectin domain protein [Candidatus Saccharimonadales bacterium]